MTDKSGNSGAQLWRYALAAWRTPGVEAGALKLQDNFAVPVALLLTAGWLGSRGYPPHPALAQQLGNVARDWEAQRLAPLRAVRRQAGQRGQWAEWKRLLQDAELEAERLLLAELEALVQAAPQALAGDVTLPAWLLLLVPDIASCQEQDALVQSLYPLLLAAGPSMS